MGIQAFYPEDDPEFSELKAHPARLDENINVEERLLSLVKRLVQYAFMGPRIKQSMDRKETVRWNSWS